MRPIAIDLYGQTGQRVHASLHPGWNPLPSIKAGVWVYDTSLVIWNALAGAGELFLDRIELTFDNGVTGVLPRSAWSVAGPVLKIGNGHEYMAPQSNLNVRWAYPHRCPTSVHYGPVVLQFTPAMKRDIFTALAHSLIPARATGMWAPFNPNDMDPGAPGGTGIAAIAGWEQDAAGFLLRHDMVMDRCAIGYLDATTGQPVIAPPSNYTTVRGWSKATQIDVFCDPHHGQDDDSRSPLVTWPGTCSYRDVMLGKAARVPSYMAPDDEHLCRVNNPVRAAVQCGDPAAQMSQAMIAANCMSGRRDGSALPVGSRNRAWTIDALYYQRNTLAEARRLIAENVAAQTASGSIMRASNGYPFSPSPWTVSSTIPVPIPADEDVDPVGIERMLTLHSCALDNRKDTIKRGMDGAPWPVTKFVGVGKQGGPAFATYQHPVGHAGWDVWIGIGSAAALDVEGWQEHATQYATPSGHVIAKQHQVLDAQGHPVMVDRPINERLLELRNVLRAETVGNEQTVGVLCVLEAMHLG